MKRHQGLRTGVGVWVGALGLSVLGLWGCGSSPSEAPAPETTAAPPEPGPAERSTETAPPTSASPAVEHVDPEVPFAPVATALEEVDLLHAVAARIAVSSAYHDDASQVARIADGDLETAWNSRTSDLGAFIDIDVPADATVRAIALTPGFTHVTPRADLFTGNLRISRVRLSRNGEVLGEHELDTTSRVPVEIPVGRPGGLFHLEVIATLPGERADWQEICVSEILVLGTSAGAAPGTRSPDTSVGSIAVASAASSATAEAEPEAAADPEEAARAALESCVALLERWRAYGGHLPLGVDDAHADPTERSSIVRERQAVLEDAARLFVDTPDAASEARRLAAITTGSLWWGRDADIAALLSGCDARMAPHPTEACGWSETRTLAQLTELAQSTRGDRFGLESTLSRRRSEEGLPLDADELAERRAALERLNARSEWLDEVGVEDWVDLDPRHRATLRQTTVIDDHDPRWLAILEGLQRVERDCAADATPE